MSDFRPTTGKAEWHLTYACNLECACCNRASFLKKPHTGDMTLEDAHEFCRQARALNWQPRIIIIGGEPTLHHDFEEFVKLAREFSRGRGDEDYVQVFSNGNTPRSRSLLFNVRMNHDASVTEETHKRESVELDRAPTWWTDDVYVSPTDFGEPLRAPCYQHSSQICGISVDHEGYAPCAMGGALDALLNVGGRTKVLADLFDEKKMAEMTAALCKHCGHQAAKRENVAKCETLFGTPMSPTWVKAFEGRR